MSENLLSLWTPDMAVAGCDFAFIPAAGKLLNVLEFKALFDSDVDSQLRTGPTFTLNPLRVCMYRSYGAAWAPYNGTHTPLPVDGVDGWVLDSNNPIESVQEYKRWWHAATGRAIIEFCFNNVFDVATKADVAQSTIGGVVCSSTSIPYAAMGISLSLKSSLNERIEVWQDRQEPYLKANGAPVAIARMACVFTWSDEV